MATWGSSASKAEVFAWRVGSASSILGMDRGDKAVAFPGHMSGRLLRGLGVLVGAFIHVRVA